MKIRNRQRITFALAARWLVTSILTALSKPFRLGSCILLVALVLRSSVYTSAVLQTIQVNDEPELMVLSYSLYGNKTQYLKGMITIATEVPDSYPGWQVRVYHDNRVPADVTSQLASMSHVKLVNVESDLPQWVARSVNPMSWRFIVAADPKVKAYGIRDGDSRPSKREKAAVDEWLRSKKAFHIMRDHPMHDPSRFAVILGGMWGGIRRAAPNMEELLHTYYNSTRSFKYAEDQDFLWSYILPLAKNDCFQHDSYFCKASGGIAFPMSREDTGDSFDFVGNAFNRVSDIPRPTQDPRLVDKRFFPRYKECLDLRQSSMSHVPHDKSSEILPDTSYKGRSDMSSTEMWEKLLADKQKLRTLKMSAGAKAAISSMDISSSPKPIEKLNSLKPGERDRSLKLLEMHKSPKISAGPNAVVKILTTK